jgi:DNA invertase Pin-like site-specific DNA recombinase
MANTGKFVAYYRVSTPKQGKSGLGLEAQKQAVATYLNGGSWEIVGEFVEVESGKRADRRELDKALAAARLHRCPLIVSKVDRLTRSVSFLSRLLDANVDVRFADLPQIEGATGRFLLQQMVAVAELEAGMISKRTKDALGAAKKRGKKLGGFRGKMPTAKARRLAVAAIETRAEDRAAESRPDHQGATGGRRYVAESHRGEAQRAEHSDRAWRRRMDRDAGDARAGADRGPRPFRHRRLKKKRGPRGKKN